MIRRRNRFAGVAAMCALALAACATTGVPEDRVAAAVVDFVTPTGGSAGSGILWQDPLGVVHIEAQLRGLQPGQHGIHFHEVGRCDGAGSLAFASAGSHYNPGIRKHGLDAPDGPHAGDAPNITAGSDGRARVHFTTDRVTLTSGPFTLDDADGSSLVVHALNDDQVTDPSGNSGARIACAVVRIR